MGSGYPMARDCSLLHLVNDSCVIYTARARRGKALERWAEQKMGNCK